MRRRILGIGGVVVGLAAASESVHWWLPKLLPFLDTNGSRIQTIGSAMQIVLWSGAGLALLLGLRRKSPKPDGAIAAQGAHAGRNIHEAAGNAQIGGIRTKGQSGGVNVSGGQVAVQKIVGRDEVTIIQQAPAPPAHRAPVDFFNLDGTEGPLSVSGKQHSAQGPRMDLWCNVTIVNNTPTPAKITPLRLLVNGAEWPAEDSFFRPKSNTQARYARISLLGNWKEDYELHFIFPDDNCPQAQSGDFFVRIDSQDEPVRVGVTFP